MRLTSTKGVIIVETYKKSNQQSLQKKKKIKKKMANFGVVLDIDGSSFNLSFHSLFVSLLFISNIQIQIKSSQFSFFLSSFIFLIFFF